MPAVSAEKEEYASRMNKYLDTYSRVLFCNLDNVRSEQMHNVRRAMRGKGEVLVGKKTMQKRILQIRADADGASEIDKKLAEALVTDNRLVGNLALVFTNQDIATVREVLREYRVQAPARVGAIAPVDVTIQAGNTGLEPTMTSFFQALNIPTKIAKGTVEIVSDKKVLAVGDKVDSSTAALLQKLGISPFFYAVEVEFYWQNGMLFTAEDLNTSTKVIEDSVLSAISSISAMSLATGILTEASFPHAVVDGFKNLLAASVESEFVFEEFNGAKLRKDVKEGKVAAAAPAAASKTAAPAAAAAPVEEEEEEDFGMGGLF